MERELKARVIDLDKAEDAVRSAGAKFVEESIDEYTYFNQPHGFVLKITKSPRGCYRTRMIRDGETFLVIEHQLLDDPDAEYRALTNSYGVKKILKNHQRRYELDSKRLSMNSIPSVGDFIILRCSNPDTRYLQQVLGTSKLNLTTFSFDDCECN